MHVSTEIVCGWCKHVSVLYTNDKDKTRESAKALKLAVSDSKGMRIEFHCSGCKAVTVLPRFIEASNGETQLATY